MKLSRRQENSYEPEKSKEEKVYQKPVKVDWKLYMEDHDALIPYGKWVNKSLGWIIDHEQDYYHWLKINNLLGTWGLIKLKPDKEKERHEDHFIASDGSVWVCIIEKEL